MSGKEVERGHDELPEKFEIVRKRFWYWSKRMGARVVTKGKPALGIGWPAERIAKRAEEESIAACAVCRVRAWNEFRSVSDFWASCDG